MASTSFCNSTSLRNDFSSRTLTAGTCRSRTFIRLFKSPSEDDDADGSGQTKRYRSKIRALIRVFVLATSDYQIILVGAFILSYAGKGKCELTSYHFTTTVDLMMISLSVIVFSVALVRTYWRHPVAALFRVLLSVTVFIGVALTVFEKNSYSPEWIPPRGRHDSAILLPVACLLEPDLYLRAKSQSEQSQADLGFHSPPSRWPAEKYFYILLALAFLTAHVSVMVRRLQGRLGEGNPTERKWSRSLGKLTIVYWLFVLLTPAGVIIACWVRIYLAREWVRGSGWISEPNPEFNLWDSGQLLPIVSGVVLILMATATEAKSTKAKAD